MSRRFRDVLLRRLDAALVPAEPIEEPGDEWYARELALSQANAYVRRRMNKQPRSTPNGPAKGQ